MTAYDRPRRIVHWISSIFLVLLFGLGLSITRLLDGDIKLAAYAWHEWLGLTLLVTTFVRLVLWTRPAPPPPVLPWHEALARRTVHTLMYAMLIAVPVSGWCMTQAFGFPIVYLGILPLPAVIAEDRDLAVRLQSAHVVLAMGLALLVGLHVAALVKHQFIDGDGVLARMWPSRTSPRRRSLPTFAE